MITKSRNAVRPGDAAPDFTATDERGTAFRLSDYRGRNVVLFFYPKANSRGCTAQACAFRDAYTRFQDAGADVIGISSDDTDEQRAFATNNALPYRLASDTGSAIRNLYGVPKTLGILAGRVTYVIDDAGIVRHVFDSQSQLERHVTEALGVLEGITRHRRERS